MDEAGGVAMLSAVALAFVFLAGASIGSFLNVVAYRLPAGLSIVRPRSHCPFCKTTIPGYDNVPVLSWFFLGARCRFCGIPISARYPAVEALTGALAVLLVLRFGPSAQEWASGVYGNLHIGGIYFAFAAALVAISLIDWDVQIVPDEISLPGIALGLAASWVLPPTFVDALIGAAVGGGLLLAVSRGYFLLTRREGMGLGDAKLMAMIGAFLGWQSIPMVLLAASVTGTLAGLVLIRVRGKGLRHAFAFGPFLCLAAIAYVLVGDAFNRWYMTGLVLGR
jgi:leader peptidase (prepilin peptidase) / N-methyltransferase